MRFEYTDGNAILSDGGKVYADSGYQYTMKGYLENGESFEYTGLDDIVADERDGSFRISGIFGCGLGVLQSFTYRDGHIEEEITLENKSRETINIDDIGFGLTAALDGREDWRLCAVPFRSQLDGNIHDYPADTLIRGSFRNFVNGEANPPGSLVYGNSVYKDYTRDEPELAEKGILRSEAWAWGTSEEGIVIIKYNNNDIEYSVACPLKDAAVTKLRFGGAGLCLYGEPGNARSIGPGGKFVFGKTAYIPYKGTVEEAFYVYRRYIKEMGHGPGEDYDPPVNWNELYDIGWYHSDQKDLKKHYNRSTLMKEAQKASLCGCDLLYLDPGWEVAEGTTLWDWTRLGRPENFIKEIKEMFGLDLGYRTILHCYINYWPHGYLIRKNKDRETTAGIFFAGQLSWPVCMCFEEFFEEKLRRIIEITGKGVKFMMFDEMDWRGICVDSEHGHHVPTTVTDHVDAVYRLAKEVRDKCPGLITEVHDPVWPWHHSLYVPTYFRQGVPGKGCYDENWGFEYMWNCLQDLRSGKALALYYYNLGSCIPLYLHISMAADNDNCLFFWWAASTVRHIGIGGRDSDPSVETETLPPFDHESRFNKYCEQMKIYKKVKKYFCRGDFYGISEYIHLHVIPGIKGGVVNVFNITDDDMTVTFKVPYRLIGSSEPIAVSCGDVEWLDDSVGISVFVRAMSPEIIFLGEAAEIIYRSMS